jgi:hypothetical protein
MRHARFLLGLMAGSLLIAGCMKPFFSSSNARSQAAHPPRAYFTPAVAVRFFMPPDAERYGDMTSDTSMQLVVDSKYKGFVDADNDGIADTPDSQPMHVALWGGPFYGHETTYTLTSLDPGDYTFAVIDRDKAKAIQGWIHVNHSGLEVADILQRWKAEMPKMKQWLAYDFELQGKLNTSDAQVFESFARQLRAFERLERELDQAIAHELEVQHSSRQQNSATRVCSGRRRSRRSRRPTSTKCRRVRRGRRWCSLRTIRRPSGSSGWSTSSRTSWAAARPSSSKRLTGWRGANGSTP